MRNEKKTDYGTVRLLDIECDEPADFTVSNATHLRVSLPSGVVHQARMLGQGFSFADRTLDVSVNLGRVKTDFGALVRLRPMLTDMPRADVEQIALESFPTDSRFHFGGPGDSKHAAEVLSGWMRELGAYYLCEYKGAAAGFLALREAGPGCRFVHLAAVGEKYRAAGVAVSLYAHVAAECRVAGIRQLTGRISSENVAVMNLYMFLGATFANPRDVYVKEV